MKAKINLKNSISYLIGNYRYKFYYSNWRWLIREHIREQIAFRVTYMDKECYSNGECKLCGCATTALQMANKACDKPCYPSMMNKEDWRMFSTYCSTIYCKETKGTWRWYNREHTQGKRNHLYFHPDGTVKEIVIYPNGYK